MRMVKLVIFINIFINIFLDNFPKNDDKKEFLKLKELRKLFE